MRFLPTVQPSIGAIETQHRLLWDCYVQRVCPLPGWDGVWWEKRETECIVTPCSEPKGDRTRSQNSGLKGNYPHPRAQGYSGLFSRTEERSSALIDVRFSNAGRTKGDKDSAMSFNRTRRARVRYSSQTIIQIISALFVSKKKRTVKDAKISCFLCSCVIQSDYYVCLFNSTFHCGTWRMLICSVRRHLPPSLSDCALQLGPLGNSCG